ncbi:hypothetical protein [Burkholderia alba]|uniref:hypothetical protein n=1 Tax=Burkholderia alba TaxID=2683677 RepID=UPI002B05E22E|nr:hypothetical protein [Burkholderia alba]
MATRRQFLLTVSAVGASRMLTACGGDGQPSVSSNAASTAAVDDSLRRQAAAASASLPFYGINAHLTYDYAPVPAWTTSTYVSTFKNLGVQWVRTNVADPTAASALVPFLKLFAANGIAPLVVIDMGVDVTQSYAANYSAAWTLGSGIARALNGYCSYFECGNEVDITCRVDYPGWTTPNPVDGKPVDGSVPTDYVPAAIEAMRGWTAGMSTGIKTVIPAAKCGYASGVAYSYVVADMLYNGKDIAGATTQPPIALDFMGVHWYAGENDVLAAGPSTHTNQFVNVLQQLNVVMPGKPLIVSEFGTWDTAANQAQYLTSQFDVWRTHRTQYNIAAASFYALFPNPADQGETLAMNWGIMQADGTTKKAAYAAYRSYTSAHPA